MRNWTQKEYDEATEIVPGAWLGTGNFTGVHFKGRTVQIGPNSLIGSGAELGAKSAIGDHCDIGSGLALGPYSHIGRHCHIGPDARIGEHGVIGRGTCIASGADIGMGTDVEDHVQLPKRTRRLFGIPEADGQTMIKCVIAQGTVLYAFAAREPDGMQVHVLMDGRVRTIDEFEAFAQEAQRGYALTTAESRRVAETARYIRAMFARGA